VPGFAPDKKREPAQLKVGHQPGADKQAGERLNNNNGGGENPPPNGRKRVRYGTVAMHADIQDLSMTRTRVADSHMRACASRAKNGHHQKGENLGSTRGGARKRQLLVVVMERARERHRTRLLKNIREYCFWVNVPVWVNHGPNKKGGEPKGSSWKEET